MQSGRRSTKGVVAMSSYGLNKLIRDYNRDPLNREHCSRAPHAFVAGYDLTADETQAFLDRDIGKLYRLGVHGLILRPFTIINRVSETDYLQAIRG